MTDEPRITYEYPVFPEQTQPTGLLLPQLECQAAWYYYVLAHKHYCQTQPGGQFGLLEGSPWLEESYVNILRTVLTMYGIKRVEDMMKFMPIIMMECERLGMMAPQLRYLKPMAIQ